MNQQPHRVEITDTKKFIVLQVPGFNCRLRMPKNEIRATEPGRLKWFEAALVKRFRGWVVTVR